MSSTVRVTIFGSSAGFPTKRRTNTSIGIWRDRDVHLFDAGEPVAWHLARRGLSPDQVGSVFITHMHADHTGGLPMLLQWLQLNRRTRPLSLHLPAVAVEPFRAVLEMHYLFFDILGFELNLHPLRAGQVYEEAGISVMARETRHLDHHAERMERAGKESKGHAFSFVVTTGGKRIFLSGDLGQASEVIAPASGADLAVVEMAHFTPEAIGEALSHAEVPRVVLTHLIHTLEPVEDEVPARVKAAGYTGEVYLARDGDEFEV